MIHVEVERLDPVGRHIMVSGVNTLSRTSFVGTLHGKDTFTVAITIERKGTNEIDALEQIARAMMHELVENATERIE